MTQRGATLRSALIDVAVIDRPVSMADLSIAPLAGCGAESVFLGRTRGESHPERGELVALEYEVYREMAEGVIRRICQAATAEFGAHAVVVRHSAGRVAAGEASVGVAVWAGHRDQSFGACRRVIDRLKAEAPIWKREQWTRGETWQSGSCVPMERLSS